MDRVIRFQIGDNPPARLDKALARDVPEAADLSRSRLARLLADGAVTVDGRPVTDGKAAVAAGAEVAVTLAPIAEVAIAGEAIPLDIRYEDADLIVVMKPAGLVVHPAPAARTGRWSMR